MDTYWSSVCGEEISYGKMYSHQSDRSIISKAAIHDLSSYITGKVDHLAIDKRCDASADSINNFLIQYVGRDFINHDGKYMKRVNKELRGIGFINMKKHINTMSQIVNEGIVQGEIVQFAFTDVLDWQDGDYGDGGSCFWSCHSHNRDMLEKAGHAAVLFYKGGKGIARAWALKAIFGGTRYMGLTNFYNRYTSLRRLDMIYAIEKRFALKSMNYHLNSNIYMNGDSALLGKTLPSNQDDGWIDIESFRGGKYDCQSGEGGVECSRCGDYVHEDDAYYVQGDMLCENCYERYAGRCWHCGECSYTENMAYSGFVFTRGGDVIDEHICEGCINSYATCYNCGMAVHYNKAESIDCEDYCPNCVEEAQEEYNQRIQEEEDDGK